MAKSNGDCLLAALNHRGFLRTFGVTASMEGSSLVLGHDLTNLSLFSCFCFGLLHKLLAFGFFLRHTAHLDLNLDVTFFAVLAVLTFTVFLFFVAAAA